MQNRREFVMGAAATAATVTFPLGAQAQGAGEPIKIGLLTVKTGPLASGGIDMERALVMYLAERGNVLAGRRIQLTVADTGGVPATAKAKTQELVELNKVNLLIGPLAAFEALAIDDYIKAQKIPTLSVAAAEDMTQRKPNPWFVRATSSSAQCSHVMADHCAKTLKYKRMALIADDIAYGQEMNAGFQRVFEENGGKIVQKMWPPLTAPDYGSFLAQMKTNVDAIFLGFAGSNGFRFIRQFNEYGLRGKVAIVGGMTAIDESVLRNMGDEALGIQTSCWYSAELANPVNARFAPAFRKQFGYDPGFYAAATYTNGSVLEAALNAVKGNVANKEALMAALRKTDVQTARGPVRFDEFGNVVGDVYIRQVQRKDGRLVNSVIKTYPGVSQFWTYDPKAFLANPVYSRDWPPARNLES
ncbi:MAG: transporter substrate-binding protein [Ramlibacter sp.]|jgi:branched-chain amino acid transport system substrate-binding protein|nr:transporter substrate-binding protein [Ramlibacter sp.]